MNSASETQRRLDEIAALFADGRFDRAAAVAEEVLRVTARASLGDLLAAARFLSQGFDLEPLFGHTDESKGADVVPARVAAVLAELLEPEHPAVVAARERLAVTYAIQGRAAEAASELEWVRQRLERDVPADAEALNRVRDNLAITYRNAGEPERAAALYDSVEVCEHLRAAKQHILSTGASITFAGAAWGDTRMWIYFNVVLDAAALKRRYAPADCVKIHSHRGTHDGQEHGLVCDEHTDGLMGPHPE